MQLGQVGRRQRHLRQRLTRAGGAGVVDDDVDAAVALDDLFDAGARTRRVGTFDDDDVGLRGRRAGIGERGLTRRVELGLGAAIEHQDGLSAQVGADDLAA